MSKFLSFIKTSYCCNCTKDIVTTTPDTVYKKMAEYVPILPEDTNKWSFCLPSIYYYALTSQIQFELRLQEYTIPQAFMSPTKESQLRSLLKYRNTIG